jgi:acyl-CoA dehydrogenase
MNTDEVQLVLDTLASIDRRAERVLLNDPPQWDQPFWTALEGAGLTDLDGAGQDAIAVAAVRSCAALRRRVPLAERVLIAAPLARAHGWPLPAGVIAVAPEVATCGIEARVQGEGLVLDGTTREVPWAPVAGHVLMTVTAAGSRYTVLAPVTKVGATRTPGAHPTAEIEFSSQVVTLATEGDAVLEAGAFARTVQCVGAIEGVLAMAVEYAGQREQFGRPIARFQAVQHMLAELAGESAVAGAALMLATREGSGALELATARLCASAAAAHAVRIGHQVHGAIGFTDEYPLGVLTRSLQAWRTEFGGEAFWADRLFEVLAAGGVPLWPVMTEPGGAA